MVICGRVWCVFPAISSTHAGVLKTTNMSVTCLGADPSTRIEPGGHINPVDPNLAPSLGPQGVFRAHLWSAALTHPENGHFHVENGAMGGINGTCDAWCGSRSHKHIRVDCYELLCTILGALWLVTALKSTQKREARKFSRKVSDLQQSSWSEFWVLWVHTSPKPFASPLVWFLEISRPNLFENKVPFFYPGPLGIKEQNRTGPFSFLAF